ncbi:MAG: TPM domain-containing protein, partial [Alphaproteobacteria bacterium]
MATTVLRVVSLLVALCVASASAPAAPEFPALTGRVVDIAGLLSPEDKAQITARLKALEDKSSDQVVVVTVPSLQGYTIEDFGYQLGRHWGIGTAELDNGALLIVAPNERKVRIEVGYGLEPVLTDALTKVIIENAMLPSFRAGDYAGGIKNGVRDITLSLTGDAAEVEARARARHDADKPAVDWFTILLYIAIFLLIIYLSRNSTYVAPSGSSRRNRS